MDKKMMKFVGKVVFITLLTVFVLRTFFFESYTISTSQMESTLLKGDEVLVSKLSYGPRMPITPLSVPFAFDKFYSNLIELPYFRFFKSDIYMNDIVLFNSPSELDKPLDKRNLLVSRCVAVPSDTIMIEDGVYYINNQQYVHSPTQVDEYVTFEANLEEVKHISEQLDVNVNMTRQSEDSIFMTLNRYDAFVLNKYLKPNTFFRKDYIIPQTLMFIAPSVDRRVALSPQNIKIYKQIIQLEQGNNVSFEGDNVYINDEKVEIYTFQDDYYWMLSDNAVAALDSRELGFIPFKNVIGRAIVILYNKDENGFRSDSFLTAIQ